MLSKVSCNLCGSDHYSVLYRSEAHGRPCAASIYKITGPDVTCPERVVKCLKCGLIYVNPRPTARELLMPYIEMVDHDYIKEEEGRRVSARAILRKLSRYKKPQGRLLEIGCASGFLLDEAKKDGWDAYGVELSKWAVSHAKDKFGLNVSFGMVKKQSYPKWHFDAIVLSDTLEHLTDPKGTFVEISRILKPQGVLYLNTPNIDSLASRLFKARWWGLNQFHLYYFTKPTLQRLLDSAGFSVIKWGNYSRTFTVSYWLDKLCRYNEPLYKKIEFLKKNPAISGRMFNISAGDQIEVIAKKKLRLADLPEAELARPLIKKEKPKVTVVLPAYNAAKTLKKTVGDIPGDIVDEIILVDDASTDNTVDVARELGLFVVRHDKNRGYGANQKTCYNTALERGADIVVMVHPDYQYDPRVIPEMTAPIASGKADAVFGSRMLKGGALEGGMPLWKHNCNVIFTAIANVTLGTYLTEYHSGFRAYSSRLLRSIRFMDNSDDFVFDAEIIVQILLRYYVIDEVPIRTRYFDEASIITKWKGFWYGVHILGVLCKYGLHKNGIIKFKQFE